MCVVGGADVFKRACVELVCLGMLVCVCGVGTGVIKNLPGCVRPSMSRWHPYRTQIRVSGTAVSRTAVSRTGGS